MSTTEDHPIRRRERLRRFGFGFTALVAVAYFGFLATAAWSPARMAEPLFGRAVFTHAMVWALGLIGLSVALTAAYALMARAKWPCSRRRPFGSPPTGRQWRGRPGTASWSATA